MRSDVDRDAGRAEGRRRAKRALDGMAACRGAVVMRARRALLEALLANGTATADDVRDAIELPPEVNPVCLGAVPTALARAGIIAADGFATTCRPRAHARPLTVWRLVDREAAERWLADASAVSATSPAAAPVDDTGQRLLFDPGGATDNKKPDGGNRREGGR